VHDSAHFLSVRASVGQSKVQDGHDLIQKMSEQGISPNVVTYTAFLDLISRAGGSLGDAEGVIARMQGEGLSPNNQTFAALLSVCGTQVDAGKCTYEVRTYTRVYMQIDMHI
jgi:pentatricopeptide repeat protein